MSFRAIMILPHHIAVLIILILMYTTRTCIRHIISCRYLGSLYVPLAHWGDRSWGVRGVSNNASFGSSQPPAMAKSCWINPCHNLDNPTLPGAEKLGDGAMEPKRVRQCLPINVVNHDKPNRPLLGMVSYWVCHIRLPNLQLQIFLF